MLKKQKRSLMMESLPHHVVERIMERLPVKSLVRFKAVSKQWKSTIESPFFEARHFRRSQQSGDPDVLMVSGSRYSDDSSKLPEGLEPLRNLVLGSSSAVDIYTPWESEFYLVCPSSCDGLVCIYSPEDPGFVGNPTTRRYRPLPLSNFQQIIIDLGDAFFKLEHTLYKLGFGKDKVNGTYKPVWLYNSSDFGLENVTTCEVFDFSTNAWRYVTPSAPYRNLGPDPAYVDGSLFWLTEEFKVISLDLHTEAFHVISKAPFSNAEPCEVILCNLDNRLCVSLMKWPNQVIWSFHSGNKTWDKTYSIDLQQTNILYGIPVKDTTECAFLPLALLDGWKKKKKTKTLLFYDRDTRLTLVIHDPETKSYESAFDSAASLGLAVCYFPSLITI